jgi:hypothetical protein
MAGKALIIVAYVAVAACLVIAAGEIVDQTRIALSWRRVMRKYGVHTREAAIAAMMQTKAKRDRRKAHHQHRSAE